MAEIDYKKEDMFPIYQYFAYEHLSPYLQKISKPFHDIAVEMINRSTPSGSPETQAGLRKLLEAKDCFVRAGIL